MMDALLQNWEALQTFLFMMLTAFAAKKRK